jgi:arsenate reductase
MKIYHNPRCSKSRQSLALLQEAGLDPEVIEYLKDPPTAAELSEILDSLQMEPTDLMRTGEAVYQELGLREKQLNRQEAIETMIQHPVLIERPIVVKGNQAVIGRPPESVKVLL